MTTVATIEIESYYDRVRAALAGLAPEMRDDLLEDLPDHLAEVLAEGDGSLRDRLGEPEAYADELRAAAGVEPGAVPTAHGVHRALERGLGRATDLVRRFDLQAGRLVGYPRLVDLLRAVAPGWWVLRGWIVAQFICGTHDRSTWHGFIPRIGGNALAGLLCTIAVIAVSVWIGRRCAGFTGWPRRVMTAVSTVIALWAVLVLADTVGATSYAYGGPPDSYIAPYGSEVSDVYVYDRDGNPVVGARLFDQDGNPIQIGSPYCLDGSPATGAGPDGTATEWTYPLCPSSTGPFRSGPGPLPGAATATPTPTATPTAKSTAKASPTR
ncbi:MAG: hypothetical protein QOG22_223 [Pseudonocardiales bacterium]|nr:hypothetical protein [Pseudonocardiales bacterium]